jgi:capsular polysaccharide biosynthesis protein
MELRAYWRILRRRWWVWVLLPVLVLGLTLVTRHPSSPTYTASMGFSVGIKPEPITPGTVYTYDHYYTWLTAEYFVDDLAEVVRRSEFGNAVSQELAQQGIQVPGLAIGASTQTGKLHRILNVSVTWNDSEQIHAIASAIVTVLQNQGDTFFGFLQTQDAVVQLIDGPQFGVAGQSLRERLDLPLRLVIALLVGIAIVFLWDYLDPRVRDRADVEKAGIEILAEIPSKRRWL